MKKNVLLASIVLLQLLATAAIAAPLATLTVSPASGGFGSKVLGSTTVQNFTVKNTSLLKAATALSITGASAPFSFVGSTCGAALAPLGSCTFKVAFKPVVAGNFADTIHVGYFNGAINKTIGVGVTGKGLAPLSPANITISNGPSFNFGGVQVGSFLNHVFILHNAGSVKATSMVTSSVSPFPVVGSTCGSTLNAGTSCAVTVRFAPGAAINYAGNLKVTYFNGTVNTATNRGLLGKGTLASSNLSFGTGFFDYGVVQMGSYSTQTFSVTNSGAGPASGLFFTSPLPFTIVANSCGAVLGAGSSCSFTVRFKPLVYGVATAQLKLKYNDSSGLQIRLLKLKGRGTYPAALSWNTPGYDFGQVPAGQSVTRALSLTNTGGEMAVLQTLNLSAPFYSAGGSCGKFLPPGATCFVYVVFAPQFVGPASSAIAANYFNGTSSQSAIVNLYGQGQGAALLSLSSGPILELGSGAIGQPLNGSLVLSNLGQSDATLTSIAVGGAFQVEASSCGSVLAAGASCSLAVTFVPTQKGDVYDTISVTYLNGVTSATVARAVHAAGTASAMLTFAEGVSYDFGSVDVGSTLTRSVTLVNSGTQAINGIQLPTVGGAFEIESNTCPESLAAGASCTIAVSFAPDAEGATTSTLQVDYSDGSGSQTAILEVKGSGQTPTT